MKQEYYSPLGVELECDQKALDEICEEIRSSKAFEKLINGTPIHCQVHITDTMIGDAAVSANYSVKMNVNHGGKLHVAGMAVCIEGDQRKVVFEADRFKVNEAAQSASNNEETAFNGGLAFGGFPGAISHDGANPADGNNATAEPISSIASATGTATKTRLTDEMQELVLKAVRESDLFAALQAKIDAQTASVVDLQQAMHEAVNDALRKALKPGGLLFKR
ncbi:phage tail tip fiber protein [Enterobacter cloacae]|uniref:phage tail tip fiber protein n=1 Tax=Enterobacter cloacae TaxID=550 RepID=UPI0038907B2A